MDFDYAKAEKEFRDELEAGKFDIEYMPDSGSYDKEMESRDLAAFDDYLSSQPFKALGYEAAG